MLVSPRSNTRSSTFVEPVEVLAPALVTVWFEELEPELEGERSWLAFGRPGAGGRGGLYPSSLVTGGVFAQTSAEVGGSHGSPPDKAAMSCPAGGEDPSGAGAQVPAGPREVLPDGAPGGDEDVLSSLTREATDWVARVAWVAWVASQAV
jgi:hypothetical protein